MSSSFGNNVKIQIFGASHGAAVGCVVDGLPAGERVDLDELYRFMCRRRPGASPLTTARSEADRPVFLSGLTDGVTSGSPLCAVIENTNVRSADYAELRDKPRPGHADYTARLRFGEAVDMRGGGHFSGRLTAPLCIAGGVAKQILTRRGIFVGAQLLSVGGVCRERFPLAPTPELFDELASAELPEDMQRVILSAKEAGDSVGGVVECAAVGVPGGLGDPMFDGMENRLAAALFGIPAVKGVDFGSGFDGARRLGSENNDPFTVVDGKIMTTKNDAGGILGGITDGMPIVLRCAIKPTPSIAKEQDTVSLSEMKNAKLAVKGRHDPCIAVRAVPVVEAVTALVLLDAIL